MCVGREKRGLVNIAWQCCPGSQQIMGIPTHNTQKKKLAVWLCKSFKLRKHSILFCRIDPTYLRFNYCTGQTDHLIKLANKIRAVSSCHQWYSGLSSDVWSWWSWFAILFLKKFFSVTDMGLGEHSQSIPSLFRSLPRCRLVLRKWQPAAKVGYNLQVFPTSFTWWALQYSTT